MDHRSMLLRRALLVAADAVDEPLELRACAEAARAANAGDVAQMLEELAALHQGFATDRSHAGATVEIALAELARLAAVDVGADVSIAAGSAEPDIRADVGRLFRFLASTGADDAVELLAGLREELLAGPVLDLRDLVDADLDTLAAGFARRSLRAFLAAHEALAFAPFGSPALLHAAARLDPAALGPYLTRVGNLLRNGRDLIGLIDVAGIPPADRERWTVLLALHIDDRQRAELIDELGDLGRVAALDGILEGIALRGVRREEIEVLARLRDAALDNLALPLAIGAQRLRAGLTQEWIDWALLGDIHVAAGEWEAAQAAYAHGIGDAPATGAMLLRVEALRLREARFAPVGGVDNPEGQRHTRLARHGIVPPRRPKPDLAAA